MSDTITTDPKVQRYEADLLDGTVFARHAESARSAYGYRPCLDRRAWSHAVTTIGQMAARSDALAQVAAAILPGLTRNTYTTRPEASAAIYEGAAAAIRAGYDDVIGRSGPEAGRHSDHQRPFRIDEVVLIAYYLIEATRYMAESVVGPGWALAAVREQHDVPVPAGIGEAQP